MTRRIKNMVLRCYGRKRADGTILLPVCVIQPGNVFNAEGKITLDTPEMMQARPITATLLPTPCRVLTTSWKERRLYERHRADGDLLHLYPSAVIKEGDPKNVGFVVPTEKTLRSTAC